jgi:hypothetical protein
MAMLAQEARPSISQEHSLRRAEQPPKNQQLVEQVNKSFAPGVLALLVFAPLIRD